MRNLAVRSQEEEWMDAPDLDPGIYAEILGDLAKVNRFTLAKLPILSFLKRSLAGRKRFRLLDVGFGEGDMLRAIALWASRCGIEAELTGIDLNAGSAPVALAHTPADLPIRFRTGDYLDYTGAGFDFVVSNLVAHHMRHSQLIQFLRFMEREAALGWFISDLHRHRLSAMGFPILATIMGWHDVVKHDGTLSIARSYRPDEWAPILAEAEIDQNKAKVFRAFPFRLCVERLR